MWILNAAPALVRKALHLVTRMNNLAFVLTHATHARCFLSPLTQKFLHFVLKRYHSNTESALVKQLFNWFLLKRHDWNSSIISTLFRNSKQIGEWLRTENVCYTTGFSETALKAAMTYWSIESVKLKGPNQDIETFKFSTCTDYMVVPFVVRAGWFGFGSPT